MKPQRVALGLLALLALVVASCMREPPIRVGREPGYSAVATYDAADVLADGLARAAPGETPRDAVLRHGPYEGLQERIVFDRFGDTSRKVYFSVMRRRGRRPGPWGRARDTVKFSSCGPASALVQCRRSHLSLTCPWPCPPGPL